MGDLPAYIERKIDRGDCWLWRGGVDKDGYGKVQYQKRSWRAHRLVYTLLVAEIPAGLELDHKVCVNPPCVNPAHMEPVPPKVNWERGSAPSRINRDKDTCVRGHDLTDPANLYPDKKGRRCRTCNLEWQHQRYQSHTPEERAEYNRKQRERYARKVGRGA